SHQQVLQLGERDLAFDDDELRRLAEARQQPDRDLEATGGWPALAELALLGDSTPVEGRFRDFLLEEVANSLDESDRELLVIMGAVGPIDDALASRLIGRPVDLATSVGTLPLVDSDGSVFEAHALWEFAVGSLVTGEQRAAWQREAIQVLQERGDVGRAFQLAIGSADPSAAIEVMAGVCRPAYPQVPLPVLGGWVRLLPPELRDHPVALLAEALSLRNFHHTQMGALLQSACEGFRTSGDVQLELIGMLHLGVAAWTSGDTSPAADILGRIGELAEEGHPLAVALAAVGRALFSEMFGDIDGLFAALDELDGLELEEPLWSLVLRYRGASEWLYRDARLAVQLAEESLLLVLPELRFESRIVSLWARWTLGALDPALEELGHLGHDDQRGLPIEVLLGEVNRVAIDAWLGRGDSAAAQHQVERLRFDSNVSRLALAQVMIALARAAVTIEHDEARAATDLRDELEHSGMPVGRSAAALARLPALGYVLLPETRSTWDTTRLGTGPEAALATARVLLAARDDAEAGVADAGWVDEAASIVASPAALCTWLPCPWAVELALRVVAARPGTASQASARAVVDRLGAPGYRVLRSFAAVEAPSTLVTAARGLLAGAVVPPTVPLVLRLFGPTTVERDGTPIDAPEWRRERVRALLALVCRRGSITRDEASATLWPDLDPARAANNLRVTLSYLRRVLEPERSRAEPPFHVRAEGVTLRFAGGEWWSVDVTEFERLTAEAARLDQQGSPSLALGAYLEALEWYRGPLLADLDLDAADDMERERLRSRFVRAAVRAGDLLVATGRPEEAIAVAARACREDPWSEPAYRLEADGHLALGDRAAAVRAYRRCLAVLDELGLPPEPETERLGRHLGV
ncbi:MAG TPA: BTAD domain-containing putative transcriptional regulator, partial [Microthrixaceae bacterium]|nr:BTAD domain-containing putative transcriptional regulator [Microthrixaceae bacterium]